MEEDFVLSDIHVHTPLEKSQQNYITRFFFNLKTDATADCFQQQENNSSVLEVTEFSPVVDKDGDILIPPRQNNAEISGLRESHLPLPFCPYNGNSNHEKSYLKDWKEVITIEHKLQTVLKEVGYQVWLGALLMCDYLINCSDSLIHHTVLDLGAGTGLTSIVAAMFAKSVICTDYSPDIVNLAEKNWKRNSEVLPSISSKSNVRVQVLDWTKHQFDSGGSEKEVQHLYNATLILAAEVVYDDNLTDAFFQTIYFLLRKSPCKTVIMAVEKRIVFDMAWQDVCSPSYEHFQENLKDLCSVDEGSVHFTCQQIPSQDIPQYFLYKRTAQLELWKIMSHFLESRNSDETE